MKLILVVVSVGSRWWWGIILKVLNEIITWGNRGYNSPVFQLCWFVKRASANGAWATRRIACAPGGPTRTWARPGSLQRQAGPSTTWLSLPRPSSGNSQTLVFIYSVELTTGAYSHTRKMFDVYGWFTPQVICIRVGTNFNSAAI